MILDLKSRNERTRPRTVWMLSRHKERTSEARKEKGQGEKMDDHILNNHGNGTRAILKSGHTYNMFNNSLTFDKCVRAVSYC